MAVLKFKKRRRQGFRTAVRAAVTEALNHCGKEPVAAVVFVLATDGGFSMRKSRVGDHYTDFDIYARAGHVIDTAKGRLLESETY